MLKELEKRLGLISLAVICLGLVAIVFGVELKATHVAALGAGATALGVLGIAFAIPTNNSQSL